MSDHLAYVAASYAVALGVLAALALWVYATYRLERRRLDELEAHLGRAPSGDEP